MAFTCPQCNRTSHHPDDEKHGYCGNCHEFTGLKADHPTGVTLMVAGIVAARNEIPYVQIASEQKVIAQLTVAEARKVAFDILTSAHNATADAMIIKFFRKTELPREALAAFMQEFRNFRHELEHENVEGFESDPDTGEKH